MTYYTEIQKSSGRKRKAKFWESDVIGKKNETRRIGKLKGEKDADETVRKRTTRKIIGIRFSLFQFFFCLPEVVNFRNFLCLLSFIQFTNLLGGKLIF